MAEIRLILGLFLGLFLSVDFADSSDVVGHEPVNATVGEDVVLPCHLEPPFDVSTLTVEWTLRNLSMDDRTVHVYRDRKDDHPQDEQFRNRTSLFPEEMSRGNISLKLTSVRLEDSGLYICYVPKLQSQVKRGNVTLTVLLKVHPQEDAGRSGGNTETKDNKKESGVQTGATVGSVVGAVIVIIVLGIVWIYKDRLRTWWNERRGTEGNNYQPRERANSAELDRLNPDPDQIPQGPDPDQIPQGPDPDQIPQGADPDQIPQGADAQ